MPQDCYPKILINATFLNQSLKFDPLVYCHAIFVTYTYQLGITVEYEFIMFYINQTGLSQLPDGNYTLWRPIGDGDALPAIITMNSGNIDITYYSFDNPHTDKVTLSVIFPLLSIALFSYTATPYTKRRTGVTC
ncbi:MAG: hypothetical protein ACTSQE_00210 [Candidatus Heimdallarchaeaceae archaeon]